MGPESGDGPERDVDDATTPWPPPATVAAPPPPPPPTPKPDRRVRRRWIATGVGGALVVAAIAVAGVVSRDNPPRHPDDWDPRVADLVQFVQDERGLLYDHPVAIDFLTADEYSDLVAKRDQPTDSDIEELRQLEGELRAVGLISGDVDLVASMGTLEDEGTLAFYDPETERITVRGTDLTPALRVTLVHEMTHALQDQHFDLKQLDQLDSTDAQDGYRALVEGDATRIENRYVDTLSAADRSAYDEATSSDTPDLGAVPPVLLTLFGAPYVLGTDLVDLLEETGGDKAVNAAFDSPPASDAMLLDPFRFLAHDAATDVPVPPLAEGEERFEDGDLGAIAIYLFLSTRFDVHEALEGVDGWDGDAYVGFKRDGRVCFRVAVATVDADAAVRLEDLLTRWSEAAPATSPKVSRAASTVTFESCDPGASADAAGLTYNDSALALPVIRTEIGIGLVHNGAPPEAARCVAGKITDEYSVDELTAADPAQFQTPDFLAQVQGFAQACGGG